MVARVTRLVAEKFVLSTFPRALTTLSSMCLRAVRALESSPRLIMMMDRVLRVENHGDPVHDVNRYATRIQLEPDDDPACLAAIDASNPSHGMFPSPSKDTVAVPFKKLSIGSLGLSLRQPDRAPLESVVMLAIVELVS